MWQKVVLIAIALSFIGLVAQRVGYYAATTSETSQLISGEHAGSLVSLGDDAYHVETVFTSEGLLELYLLGSDASRIQEIKGRTLTAYLTPEGDTEAHAIELHPEPQEGDRAGQTSCFRGTLPAGLAGRSVQVSVPNLEIAKERFHLTFVRHAAEMADMPAPVAAAEERQLYLEPGGNYTDEDIAANGRSVPSQKYRGFQAQHDHDPQPGDQLCPVTRTKANPTCHWVIGGQPYQFCCPPCIDEFVRLAKEGEQALPPPQSYVQE